jgi:hypothetical protein
MSCPQGPAFCFYRGDTFKRTLKATEDGSALDITGYTIRFTAKRKLSDVTPEIDVNATITDAAGGIAELSLSETDTDISYGQLTYDVEYRNTSSTIVQTYQGVLTVKQKTT